MALSRVFPPLRYLNLPNLMTSSAVILTASALILFEQGFRGLPALLYLAALIMDFLDGAVARRLGQTSRFGEMLDSLGDVLNFCFVPALVAWFLGLRQPWEVAVLVGFVLAGIWRLAYFDVHTEEAQSEHGRSVFIGLSTPLAAQYFLLSLMAIDWMNLELRPLLPIYMAIAVMMMVSGIVIPKRGVFVAGSALLTVGGVCFYAAVA